MISMGRPLNASQAGFGIAISVSAVYGKDLIKMKGQQPTARR